MNRSVESAVGLVAMVTTVALVALVGVSEEARMARDRRAWQARHAESGAQLFDQACASCHGVNASGGICPPLDETSGLHGGDLGAGVAGRLAELGWDQTDAYGYVYSVIDTGRSISTRPEQYPGNRTAASAAAMAMAPWGEDYGGPLRPDQVRDLATYLAAFRSRVPDDATPRPTAPPPPPSVSGTTSGTGTPPSPTAAAPSSTGAPRSPAGAAPSPAWTASPTATATR